MSPSSLPLLFALALPTITPAQPPKTLAEMRDRYRPLLIFAQVQKIAPKHAQQVETLQSHRHDLIDRQIVLVPFYGSVFFPLDDQIIALLPGEEASLRRRFHIHPTDFTVILLGKDGGEKFRSHVPVTIDQLNAIIDAMPMRQAEMREKPSH